MIKTLYLLRLSSCKLIQNKRTMAAKKRKSVKPEFEADDSLSHNKGKNNIKF